MQLRIILSPKSFILGPILQSPTCCGLIITNSQAWHLILHKQKPLVWLFYLTISWNCHDLCHLFNIYENKIKTLHFSPSITRHNRGSCCPSFFSSFPAIFWPPPATSTSPYPQHTLTTTPSKQPALNPFHPSSKRGETSSRLVWFLSFCNCFNCDYCSMIKMIVNMKFLLNLVIFEIMGLSLTMINGLLNQEPLNLS